MRKAARLILFIALLFPSVTFGFERVWMDGKHVIWFEKVIPGSYSPKMYRVKEPGMEVEVIKRIDGTGDQIGVDIYMIRLESGQVAYCYPYAVGKR